ncbi:hypothetical protein ACHMWN_06640 [Pedobacter sp. UC225_61]|uniref:hypothetical protein n=1 Tax=Pedobacter sp. UC225_61 TaxID=3374623 RepID=UPI0037A83AB1
MDIVEFTKKIHELEVKHNFFGFKDKNDLAYWDVVRHDVFYTIYFELAEINGVGKALHINGVSKLISIYNNIWHALKLNFKLKKYSNLCFVASRYKNEKNENIDYAIKDIIDIIKEDQTLILETNIRFNQPYYYKSVFNVGLTMASYLERLIKKTKVDNTYRVSEILENHFGLKLDLNPFIKSLIIKYNIEYRYYKNLLGQVKPEKIFVVQNGIQKALFKVAHDVNIPLFEVQHGLVSFIHPAYDYPKSLNLSHLGSFPKYFLSFSNFWKNNINYPVQEKIVIGNNFFAKKLSKQIKQFELTIITADIYSKDINASLHVLLENGYEGNIALKLHPNQYVEKEIIKDEFAKYKNVKVLYNEITIKELLQISKAILAVQSTCVYEALDMNIKVLLYKIKDYKTHEDIFDNANVYQISNFNEIKQYLKRNYIFEQDACFFEPFNQSVFLSLFK